jgi:hypothetical protein
MAKASSPATELEVGGRTVRISNPDRVYFPKAGHTKLDLARYYLAPGRRCTRSGCPAARRTGWRPSG